MKKFIPFFLFLAVVTLFGVYSFSYRMATCTGEDNCKACKNCKYCKHCKTDKGTCGVCK